MLPDAETLPVPEKAGSWPKKEDDIYDKPQGSILLEKQNTCRNREKRDKTVRRGGNR
jgi:hypothetical protein